MQLLEWQSETVLRQLWHRKGSGPLTVASSNPAPKQVCDYVSATSKADSSSRGSVLTLHGSLKVPCSSLSKAKTTRSKMNERDSESQQVRWESQLSNGLCVYYL